MSTKWDALKIADWFEGGYGGCEMEAAAELRRLHEENQRLLAANRDCIDHFNQIKSDYDALKAGNEILLESLKDALDWIVAGTGGYKIEQAISAAISKVDRGYE